jgi:hypothetical protein
MNNKILPSNIDLYDYLGSLRNQIKSKLQQNLIPPENEYGVNAGLMTTQSGSPLKNAWDIQRYVPAGTFRAVSLTGSTNKKPQT